MGSLFVALAEEMREIDRKTIQEIGVPGVVLMEIAGLQVACEARKILGNSLEKKKVVILAGAGNNGGDGYVIARHLFNWGVRVKVMLLSPRDRIQGDAKVNLQIIERILAPEDIIEVTDQAILEQSSEMLESADLLIDAILGTGAKGVVEGLKKSAILLVNSLEKTILAVDIPSGLNANTGEILGSCIQATKTVSFALPKVGMLVYPGVEYVGELEVVDIGIPKQVISEMKLRHHLLTSKQVKKWLPVRSKIAHKGSCGRVLVLAGSQGMAGAAVLAAEAALRMGAGLVTLAVPESLYPLLVPKVTEIIIKPLPETKEGTLALQAWAEIESLLAKNDVLIIGPGLSGHSETAILVLQVLEQNSLPIVVDADGLNALAANKAFLSKGKENLIFTPHPGEMARLAGLSVQEIEDNRLELVKEKSAEWAVTLVLKGARTLIASLGKEIYLNPTGNSGMATAGSGDVLAGTIGGLLAQGLGLTQAAAAGVYLHGLAGDLAAQEKGELGLLAGDILVSLPKAVKLIEEAITC